MDEDLLDGMEEEAEAGPGAARAKEMRVVPSRAGEASRMERGLELLPLIVETIHGVRKRLRSTRDFTGLSRGKFNDPAFEQYFGRVLVEDLEKVDLALSGLLHYIRIQMPVRKSGTLERLLNRTVEALKPKVEGKGAKVFRRSEGSLPETIVPEETLRYVLDVVLRYAASRVSRNGGIGVSSKSVRESRKSVEGEMPSIASRGYVEVVTVFTTREKLTEEDKGSFRPEAEGRDELLEMELRIAQAIVEKYQGLLRLETDEKKGKAWLVLRLPEERRKVFQFRAA